ncbi:MAG TPA: oligoendopeptidase F [Firmicutes bacterium]|nr:oligoendopeptidase F [Bacillota bacterium]
MNNNEDGKTKKRLPKRAEIPDQYKWRLEDLFATDELWEEEFRRVKTLLPQAEQYKGHLSESADRLLAALQLADEINRAVHKVYVYARMRKDEDNTCAKYQALSDRAQTLATQARSALAFLNPEILAIPEEILKSYLAENAALEVYRQAIDDLLRQKPHVLSQVEEELLAETAELAQAPANIFAMINNADIKFPTIIDENGEEIEVTKGRYIQLIESKDRRVRHDAFKALYSSYEKQKNTLAATLHASVKRDCFYARVRKYPSALAAALDEDNIPTEVYTNLIQAVRAHLPLMHRYLALRKKALGLDELHMYDIYTPLAPPAEAKIPYETAKEKVLAGLRPLGDDYMAVLEKGLASAWVDVYENEGKTSGAYSWGTYGSHPYVLLNYQENLDNVFTLAHEMGHALHSYYSNQKQPFIYAGYSIFLAEVASTVNENLLLHHLLQHTGERSQRLYLLNHHLESFRTTVFRQTMFAEFEKIIHEAVENGLPLTADFLCRTYLQLNRDYYGEEVVSDPEIAMEWARIPHFYNAFYVYKYATGFSAATALSMQILNDGAGAVRRYIDFLSAGSSDYPLVLLGKAGVDMSSPEPVNAALRLFSELLTQLEELLHIS